MPDQPQADRGQAQGGVTTGPPQTMRYERGGSKARLSRFRGRLFGTSGGLACGQRVHVARRQGIAADAPVAALDFLDRHPRHSPHVLAFDRDHGVVQLLDDLSLLILAENVLDDSNLNERHFDSPVTARLTRAGGCLTLEKSDIDNSRVS